MVSLGSVMGDRAPARTALHVAAVHGRIVDPYRGDVGEPDQAAFERRDCDLQPIGEVAAAFARVPDATIKRGGRRFTLTRGADSLFVAFASASPTVALEDASWQGDPVLAIELLHALLPLFGPVELRCDDFVDLIDGHEPVDRITGRYRTHWIDSALQHAKKLGVGQAPAPPPAPAPEPTPPPRAISKRTAYAVYAVFGALIIAIVVLWFRDGWSKASTGESCVIGDDCRSGECQSLERERPGAPGVCTEPCLEDADCPRAMVCGAVIRYSSSGAPTRVRRCVDRAWHEAR